MSDFSFFLLFWGESTLLDGCHFLSMILFDRTELVPGFHDGVKEEGR